jgi:hypothetical protein
MAGDWRIYLECLSEPGANLAYVADPLNVHRRHAQSVTHSLKAQKHIDEIKEIHRVVREQLNLPRGSLAVQAKYIDEVSKQLLGAAVRPEAPALAEAPRKNRRLERRVREVAL